MHGLGSLGSNGLCGDVPGGHGSLLAAGLDLANESDVWCWWAGGAFSLTSSVAGKEHHSTEGVGGAVLECAGEAGPRRTLVPRHPAIKHVSAVSIV